jgi:hypothetical protein
MNYQKDFINSLFADLETPNPKVLKQVERINISTPISDDGEGEQGEHNVFAKIYQSVEDPTVYIKVTYFTDSYGCGSFVRNVQFVQPTEKTVISFE